MPNTKNYLKIKIDKDPYLFGTALFQESYITLKPGLNVLVGCNGAGKSTILQNIQRVCKKKDIPYYMNDSRKRSTRDMTRAAMFYGAPDAINFMTAQVEASEGEFQVYGLANRVARELGQFILRDNKNHKGDIVILLDAVNSGLSVDKVRDLKQELFGTILDEKLKPNPDMKIYIVITANTFAMIKNERAIDVQTGEEFCFSNYEDFEAFIMNSRKVRDEIDKNRTDRNGEDDDEDDEDELLDNEEEDDDEETPLTESEKEEVKNKLQDMLAGMSKNTNNDGFLDTGNALIGHYDATKDILKDIDGEIHITYKDKGSD